MKARVRGTTNTKHKAQQALILCWAVEYGRTEFAYNEGMKDVKQVQTRVVVWIYCRQHPWEADNVLIHGVKIDGGTAEQRLIAETHFLTNVPLEVLARA